MASQSTMHARTALIAVFLLLPLFHACDGGDAIATRCNGHEELCDQQFDKVTFPATHNSMSSEEDEFYILVRNQTYGISRQLEDGIRAFLIDVHVDEKSGELLLCHSYCGSGSIPLSKELETFRNFLEQNPHEVISFLIQDEAPAEDINAAISDAGLSEFVYTHNNELPWPTLREMIESGKRLIVTYERGGPPPDWGHNLWDLAWDTPYSFASTDDFSCELNRGGADNDVFLLNHWLSDPLTSTEHAETANTYEQLSARVAECQEEHGRTPTFIAVDFYEIGALFTVVDEANGL